MKKSQSNEISLAKVLQGHAEKLENLSARCKKSTTPAMVEHENSYSLNTALFL